MKWSLPQWSFHSMRARMLSWLLLLNLIPVVLLVVIGLGYAEQQLQQEVSSATERTGLRLVRALDQTIEEQLEEARLLARSTHLQQAFAGFNEAFENSEKYSMQYQAQEDLHWPYLAYFMESRSLSDLLFINRDGNVIFSAAQSSYYRTNILTAQPAEAELIRAFRRAAGQAETHLALSRSSHLAYIATPVSGDVPAGVMVFMPHAATFLPELQRHTGGGQRVSLYIPATQGRFLQWPQQQVTDPGSYLNRLLATAYLGQPVLADAELAEEIWLISARTLPALDAVVLVQQDKYAALAAVRELRISAALGAAILMVILVLVGHRVSNSVTLPLKALAHKLQKVGQGERQLSVDVNRRDEIGALAREFNSMAIALRKTQSQLVQSEKMVSIGHLAAGLAHEINNPLSVVNANLNMLDEYAASYHDIISLLQQCLNSTDPNEQQGLLEQLREGLRHHDIDFIRTDMVAILNDTRQGLHRVKHITGSLQVFAELGTDALQSVDLMQCLEHCIAQLQSAANERVDILRELNIPHPVRIRPEEMRRVFLAVLDNAFRACRPEGRIILRGRQHTGVTELEFIDSGAGMSEEQLSHIFDPFYTTRTVGEGMGLGLSVAHAIVEAHGGSIRVSSKPGKGTRVYIRLPDAR